MGCLNRVMRRFLVGINGGNTGEVSEPEGPTICVVSGGISGNRIAGLYPFFRILSMHWRTRLVGTAKGPVYEPFRDLFGEPETVDGLKPTFWMMASLLRMVRGDLIFCFQYNPWIFLPCLLMKVLRGVPMCLLVQDWDLGMGPVHRLPGLHRLYSLNHELYYILAERLARKCEVVICSGTFIQRRLGGVRIPQGTDPVVVEPSARGETRQKIGASEGDVVVMWVGKPRPWKGLEELVRAVRRASEVDPGVRLVVVGPYLPERRHGAVSVAGPVPKSEVPRLVSASDIYAVTPNLTPFSDAQLPTKVFDGMAVGRPVLATRVSDLPLLLGKYGVIVEPGDDEELAGAILDLAADEKGRLKRGIMMRKTFLKRWSTDRMEERLVPLITPLLDE